jgi:hypothetical protein
MSQRLLFLGLLGIFMSIAIEEAPKDLSELMNEIAKKEQEEIIEYFEEVDGGYLNRELKFIEVPKPVWSKLKRFKAFKKIVKDADKNNQSYLAEDFEDIIQKWEGVPCIGGRRYLLGDKLKLHYYEYTSPHKLSIPEKESERLVRNYSNLPKYRISSF